MTIVSSTTNDGSYTWTLPSGFSYYDDQYQIRIEDNSEINLYDYSAAYLQITQIYTPPEDTPSGTEETAISILIPVLALLTTIPIMIVLRKKRKEY